MIDTGINFDLFQWLQFYLIIAKTVHQSTGGNSPKDVSNLMDSKTDFWRPDFKNFVTSHENRVCN